MGGAGSGWGPDEPKSRAGRKKRSAISVCGSGVPERPSGMSKEKTVYWDRIVELTSGTSFSQDSLAIEEMADLLVMRDSLRAAIASDPTDMDAYRTRLAVGRQLLPLFGRFGFTPRDRQVLLVPAMDEEKDELESLMSERDS